MARRRAVVAAGIAATLTSTMGRAAAQRDAGVTHVVLLGDSSLDNAAYVASGQHVLGKLRQRMPAQWEASLNAVDGAVIADVPRQLSGLPQGATHLILSVGGNDALRQASMLREGAASVVEAVGKLAGIRAGFADAYEGLLRTLAGHGLPMAICTIYNARFPDPAESRIAATALCVLNDAITLAAARGRLPVVDLRAIFNDPGDYANAIEPSAQGGDKLAAAIVTLVQNHDFSGPSALFA